MCDGVTLFECIFLCKVPCSIFILIGPIGRAHARKNVCQILSLQLPWLFLGMHAQMGILFGKLAIALRSRTSQSFC